MKTFKTNQLKFFQVTDLYHVAYEQMYSVLSKVTVLKPYNLTYQQLQRTPIKIVFYSIYDFGIMAEFKITRQTQIIELFKILQRLNFSANLIANILAAILNNWVDLFKNKDLEILTFPNTPGEFYKLVFQNDKQEPYNNGIKNSEYHIKAKF
ncbi:hypothetical protein Q4502_01850 [Mesomycoplasma ovipneumoniae]|uniref:hypothetical protein n=1 Tax=Mesomycoplasma ovipneumoniae TaxID=29562 RepID=UPI0026E2020A|nr:hypothetical protein [Mesomycoplasma ovipneumoniae]MDO6856450.1 hypothetical protein [Mesomycoplasma ovipneumoniae]